jgi:hypothetical protein
MKARATVFGAAPLEIVEAATVADRTAVFHFRYRVVVGEQSVMSDQSIDHAQRTIIDPADATGVLLAAWSDGELVGTARLNLLRHGDAAPYDVLLGLASLPWCERRRISVSSRLAVSVRFRNTPLAIRFAQSAILWYQRAGVAWDYILVRSAIQGLWERLGYRRAGSDVLFPGVGSLVPLRLDLDPAYLQRVRSVLSDRRTAITALRSPCP